MIQVNYTAVPPAGSAPEMPAIPPECQENGVKGGFLAHMDAILKRSTKPEAGTVEKQEGKDAAKTETDPLTMAVASCSIPVTRDTTITTELSDLPLGDAIPVDAQDGQAVETDARVALQIQSALPSVKFAVPTEPHEAGTTNPVLNRPSKTMQVLPVSSESVDVTKLTTVDGSVAVDDPQAPEIPVPDSVLQADTKPIGAAPKTEETKTPAARNSPTTAVVSEVIESLPQNSETITTEKAISQTVARQAESSLVTTATVDESESSDDSVKSVPAAKPAAQAKMDNAARVAFENTGGNDSHSESQDAQTQMAASRVAQQARPDGSQVAAKAESGAAESHQAASAVVTATPITVNDSKLITASHPAAPAASQPPEFILEVANRIQVQLQDGKTEIRIQLHPENLGNLEIRAENTLGGVVARIVAESATVKNYLESNLHLLQQSLQDQGFKIDQIQVTVQDNGGSESFMRYAAQSGYTGSGRQGRGNSRASNNTGYADGTLVEEISEEPLTSSRMTPNSRFYTVA